MDKLTEKMKKEIYSNLEENQVVWLATVEEDRPRVRPVTLGYYDDKLWMLTGTKDAKTRQIENNANVEICCMLESPDNRGYIRFIGKAAIVKNAETKADIAPRFPFFADYWKEAGDPNCTLLAIQVKRIEYMPLGEFLATYYEV